MKSALALLLSLAAAPPLPASGQGSVSHSSSTAESPGRSRATGCSESQREAVEQARAAAILRVGRAAHYAAHEPESMRSRISEPEYLRMVQSEAVRLFSDPQFDMSRGIATLQGMRAQLARTDAEPLLVCARRGDRHCRNRDAYVVGGAAPIHLCPGFFTFEPGVTPSPDLFDKQVRTIVHEAAHLYGIGESADEEYCVMFDCITPCGPPDTTADSWAHFVHCVVGLPPDRGDRGASSR